MQWNRLSLFLKYGYPLDLVNLSLFKHEIPLQQILQLPPQRGAADAESLLVKNLGQEKRWH